MPAPPISTSFTGFKAARLGQDAAFALTERNSGNTGGILGALKDLVDTEVYNQLM